MDVFEAVDSRMSCRWFLDKPVDTADRARPDRARRARGVRRQSAALAGLCAHRRAARRTQAARSRTIIAGRDAAPRRLRISDLSGDACGSRTRAAARITACSFTARSASTASDAAARLEQYKRNLEFFNAPVALFIAIERKLGPGQWADLGGYIHALMFLARGYGLDTCAQESWARMHDVVAPVRRHAAGADAVLRGGASATATCAIRPTISARRAPSPTSFASSSGLSEAPLAPPSPRVRGEGWGEGASPPGAELRCANRRMVRCAQNCGEAPSPSRHAPPPHPARGERCKRSRSRGASERPRFAYAKLKEPPNISGGAAPGGAKVVAAPRGRVLPLARASGAARATGQSACENRLLRARCASRRSTAVSSPRRPARLGLKTALAPMAGNLPGHGLYRARFDSRYVTDMGTNVKGWSLYERHDLWGVVYELRKGANGHRVAACQGKLLREAEAPREARN